MSITKKSSAGGALIGLAPAALVLTTVSAANAAPLYNLTGLGFLAIGNASYAYGINGPGQIVGSSFTAGGTFNFPHAFLWTSGIGFKDLTPGGPNSYAYGVNDTTQIVGYFVTPSNYDNAFLWTSGGGRQNLGTLGGNNSTATGIDDPGEIVGYSNTTGSLLDHAFLWTNGGTNGITSNPQMQDLGTLGGTTSRANGINNSDQIVGSSATSDGVERAFLWTSGGTNGVASNPQMQNLGALGSGLSSHAYAINNMDQVVGSSTTVDGVELAFLWTSGSGMQSLGDGVALAVNDLDEVVGDSGGDAFLWTSGGGMQDLNNLIPASTLWTLESATGINDNGDIVGYGIDPVGYTEAYLLTPAPEPSSLVLMALGGITLVMRKRRKFLATENTTRLSSPKSEGTERN